MVVTPQLPQVTTMTTTNAMQQRRFPIPCLIVTVGAARRLVKKDLMGKGNPNVVLVRSFCGTLTLCS